jgi:hypothetical protein
MAAPAPVSLDTPANGMAAAPRAAANDAGAELAALRARAHALAAEPMSTQQRFGALEALRPLALRAAAAQRALYFGKPVPLAAAERLAWEDCVGLLQALYFAYALCADAGMETQTAATVAQRALDSLGRAIREHAGAYRSVPGTLWRELHSCFRSAVECGLIDSTVTDPAQADAAASCTSAYLATVLHDCANPYALAVPQMQALERLLPKWVGLASVQATEPLWASRSPLALDLGAECGARLAREVGSGEAVRYLDTSALGMHLRELADALRNGKPAADLDAAGELPRPALERLLTHLYVQWCSAGAGRGEERQPVRAQAALSMHAVHFQISGRAFRQPGLRYTREEEHDLATFGHITERTEQRLLTGRSAALEPWEIVAQSTAGALTLHRKPDLQTRIAHGQLIALRTSSVSPPLLAVVQRLQADANGELNVGARAIRGEVRGVAVRPAGDTAAKYERALVLEADPERNVPASLIVPAGRARPGARIELHNGRAETVVVGEAIDRGFDFERVAYTPA